MFLSPLSLPPPHHSTVEYAFDLLACQIKLEVLHMFLSKITVVYQATGSLNFPSRCI